MSRQAGTAQMNGHRPEAGLNRQRATRPRCLVRLAALAAALAGLGVMPGPTAALAEWNGASICRNSDVLRLVRERFVRSQVGASIMVETIGAYPTPDDRQVLCAITVRREIIDSAQYGDRPLVVFEPHSFLVRKLRDGFEVTRGH